MRRKKTTRKGPGEPAVSQKAAPRPGGTSEPDNAERLGSPTDASPQPDVRLPGIEATVVDSQEHLQLALEAGHISLYVADRPLGTRRADARFFEMLGCAADAIHLDPENWASLVHPRDRRRIKAIAEKVNQSGQDYFEAEYRLRHRDGHWIWVLDRALIYARDAAGHPTRVAGTCMDVSRRKEAELRLEYLVDHDELTGLLNRRGVWQSVQRMHAHGKRTGQPHCLAILDLDHFKQINDGYGHPVGDRVLISIAERLRSGLREADWLGRWGGEEFLVILPATSEAQALAVLERLRRAVDQQVIDVDGHTIRVTFSAGLAACQPLQDTPNDVLARADGALYRAKSAGRNQISYSGSDIGAHAVSMAVLIQDALQSAGILPAFQPMVDLNGLGIVGEESLARIIGADGLTLTANSFIEVAQQLGLLHRVDRMLLQATLHRMQRATGDEERPILAFVHLSDDLVRHPEIIAGLADDLQGLSESLERTPPLVLTLSERQIKTGTEKVSEALAPLLSLGCRLALGDFGGELSSFRFLTHLPISYLELDKDLVRLARESERARSILAGIQRSAQDLGIITIAKQVEDEDTLLQLTELGIDWGEGYLFGAPSEPQRVS
jgi:diguanylate cyclase (GGDEF)-like protein/PAS domain S-box-containing protein